MTEQIGRLIEQAIRRQEVLLPQAIDLSAGAESRLFGAQGQIDSLTLVSIIVEIEEQLQERLELKVCLADTSDLPQCTSPFATLGALSEYVNGKVRLALGQCHQ